MDDAGYKEKWLNFVKQHELSGYHMLANEALQKDLKNVISDWDGIPRYLIVNEKSEVVEYNALRPSNGEELFEQLFEKLNL